MIAHVVLPLYTPKGSPNETAIANINILKCVLIEELTMTMNKKNAPGTIPAIHALRIFSVLYLNLPL